MTPELQPLGDAIFEAAQKAFLKLFENGEHYYYCVLLTTGEALPPCIAAWSEEALEDSELLIITPENKQYAFEHIPITERLFRLMGLRTHIALQRRMIDMLSKTAEERYHDFLTQYPHIARRLTNIQMAAYLGVTHEFVSKIRKRISKLAN